MWCVPHLIPNWLLSWGKMQHLWCSYGSALCSQVILFAVSPTNQYRPFPLLSALHAVRLKRWQCWAFHLLVCRSNSLLEIDYREINRLHGPGRINSHDFWPYIFHPAPVMWQLHLYNTSAHGRILFFSLSVHVTCLYPWDAWADPHTSDGMALCWTEHIAHHRANSYREDKTSSRSMVCGLRWNECVCSVF